MAINKKRDFKKLSVCIQEFLSRLPCDESTGFLRDTLYLSLLELHKYYVKEKDRFNMSLRQSNETGTWRNISRSTTNQVYDLDKYDGKWHGYEENSDETKTQGFLAAGEADLEHLKMTVQSDDDDALGNTYLMYVVHSKSVHVAECIEHLLSLRFDINRQANDGSTVLHLACQLDQKLSVVTLLKHKASTTIQDNKGRAPLHWAAISTSSDITKLLLQHGANINVKDCDSMTPAMWACRFNRPENLQVLKYAFERLDPRPEAIFDERDKNGQAVLHWAVPTEDEDGLHCLKDLLVGDVSNIRNNQGRTVLHTAAQEGSVSACELILSVCGKEILDLKDNQNQTALHLATLCGHGETVDYLLQNGANILVKNGNGRTALQEAELGHYHYCLLVFAAFELMRGQQKNDSLINMPKQEERTNQDSRKYESWIIPTGLLNDSFEIPQTTTTCNIGKEEQLVDVTEIEGFEVDGDTYPSKIMGNIQAHSKTNQRMSLQRSKRVEVEEGKKMGDRHSIPVDNKEKLMKVISGEKVTLLAGNKELLDYSNQCLQQHDNASSLVSNNSEAENYCISENIEISSIESDTDGEPSTSEKEGENSNKERKYKNEKNVNARKSEVSQAKSDPSTQTQNRGTNCQGSKRHNEYLAPIKSLTQPSFRITGKLDPIPSSFTRKKSQDLKVSENGEPLQSRGTVAPLQPPALGVHQKEHSRPLIKGKGPHSVSDKPYGMRSPAHGSLAYAHGKALLNNVFQNVTINQDPMSPELQRKVVNNKKFGRFPQPPKH